MDTIAFRGALFDLDGVLVDTETTYSLFWGKMGRKYHPEIPCFDMVIKGSTLPRILETYFPDSEISEGVKAELEVFENSMDFPVFPGVMEFLADLRRNGIPAAIVTSSGADKMKRLFDRNPEFASYFDALITSADVTRSKPDPQCYLLGAGKLGVDIRDCCVFEDSISGLAAGMASGAKVIGLSTTYPAERLEQEGNAHYIMPSFEEFTVEKMMSVLL